MVQMGSSPAHQHASLKRPIPNVLAGQAYEGKVVAVNPIDSTVDIRLYSGDILRHVRVLFNSANTVAGFKYLASIENNNPVNSPSGVYDDGSKTGVADTLATIVYIQGDTLAPRVIGFSLPLDAQMHVNEQGMAMFRHESGVYSLVDKNGHFEIHYPDGSYIIAGPDADSKNITSSGQPWSIPGKPAINIKISHSSGSFIAIAPDGLITIHGRDSSVSY
jgi:hypothetical protein